MKNMCTMAVQAYWGLTLVVLGVSLWMIAAYAPVEATMGPVQKIFYLHLPVALNAFLAAFAAFVAGIGYLWSRSPAWDDLSGAAVRVAWLCCSILLLTGMLWAKSAWGHWWTWSPRLTFSLVLWLLYSAYLVVRPTIESDQRRAVLSAVYAVVAFLDVPLVYLCVKVLPDIHPSSVELTAPMRSTLLVASIAITMFCAGLIGGRYTLSRRRADDRSRLLTGAAPPLGALEPRP